MAQGADQDKTKSSIVHQGSGEMSAHASVSRLSKAQRSKGKQAASAKKGSALSSKKHAASQARILDNDVKSQANIRYATPPAEHHESSSNKEAYGRAPSQFE